MFEKWVFFWNFALNMENRPEHIVYGKHQDEGAVGIDLYKNRKFVIWKLNS